MSLATVGYWRGETSSSDCFFLCFSQYVFNVPFVLDQNLAVSFFFCVVLYSMSLKSEIRGCFNN